MPDTKRIIAIGDIHGCLNSLKTLIDKLNYDREEDKLIFVGDYIDRGKWSYETVKYLRKLRNYANEGKPEKDNCILLRGNHEQMLIDCDGVPDALWLRNGAASTVESFWRNNADTPDSLPFFNSLPLLCEAENAYFCHAGFTAPIREENTDFDLLWGRNWIDIDFRPREKTVIFGHTPNPKNGQIYTTLSGDICIDGGCVYGGNLCALVIYEDGSAEKFQVHQHQGDK